MAIVLSDVGADEFLAIILNDTRTGTGFVLRLFTNSITPADTDVVGAYTEASGSGYAAKTLAKSGWTITTGNDPSDGVYAQQTFTFTGPLAGSATVYGYYVTDTTGAILLWAERFPASLTPYNNGDNVKVTPKFQLSKGTPTA